MRPAFGLPSGDCFGRYQGGMQGSTAMKQIAGIDFVFNVIQTGIIVVGDDHVALSFESLYIINDFTA